MVDLQNFFWQVPLDEEIKPVTAFQAGQAFYEYEVMCFELRKASSVFQRMMSEVIEGLLQGNTFLYLEDIWTSNKSKQMSFCEVTHQGSWVCGYVGRDRTE